jgi:hypothetical protein
MCFNEAYDNYQHMKCVFVRDCFHFRVAQLNGWLPICRKASMSTETMQMFKVEAVIWDQLLSRKGVYAVCSAKIKIANENTWKAMMVGIKPNRHEGICGQSARDKQQQ